MRDEIRIALDNVIFSEDLRKVILIKRKYDPFKDLWALPAGHLNKNELLDEGAKRELFEETGLKNITLKRFDIFDALDRDPRGRTISVAYIGIVGKIKNINASSDAKDVKWFPVDDLPRLAFDHNKIIQKARTWIKK